MVGTEAAGTQTTPGDSNCNKWKILLPSIRCQEVFDFILVSYFGELRQRISSVELRGFW